MAPEPVETRNLRLRPFEPRDVEALWRIQGDRDAMRFTFCPETREACAEHLGRHAALRAEVGYAPWTALHRARIVGWGGLGVDPVHPGWGPEVSYFFAREVWGRGFATELVRASLRAGFGEHGLEKIRAFTRSENAASARVLRKCGFEMQRHVHALERDLYEIARDAWQPEETRCPS